jgi:hypothetical protein
MTSVQEFAYASSYADILQLEQVVQVCISHSASLKTEYRLPKKQEYKCNSNINVLKLSVFKKLQFAQFGKNTDTL